jgi:hypothetical protein
MLGLPFVSVPAYDFPSVKFGVAWKYDGKA